MSAKEDEISNHNAPAQNQYLLFLAASELYAIEALKAQEIVEYTSVTKVPMMNSYVKGVTNIRGNIVPVIDLIDRLGLGGIDIGDKTSIVVVNYKQDDEVIQIGIMIDEVREVENIPIENIIKAPEFGFKIDTRYVLNMGKYDKKYITILNTDTILNIDELSKLFI